MKKAEDDEGKKNLTDTVDREGKCRYSLCEHPLIAFNVNAFTKRQLDA